MKFVGLGIVGLVCLAGCQRQAAPPNLPSRAATSSVTQTPTEPPAEKPSDPSPEKPADPVPVVEAKMSITKSPFGKTEDGQAIDLYTCRNPDGLVVKLTNYGAIVVSVETPDRDGKLANITLGFPTLDGYLKRHPYFGATVGRFCNRIAGGKFKIGDQEYTLAKNNGENHLHGGVKGFDKAVWQAQTIDTPEAVGVQFTYVSQDLEEGYPGNLLATATYKLTSANELHVEFLAETEKATPVNLTNHNYWNLGGAGSGTILEHQLTLSADKYLEVGPTLIPTGKLADVAGTPLDFTTPQAIGSRLKEIVADPVGYDHCYVVRAEPGAAMALAARVKDPASGRVMEIRTTQPGIQFYTGNFLNGTPDNGGYKQYEAFCLETQHFPDSPNQPTFPNTVLQPGEKYRQVTVHKFSVEKE